MDLQKKKKKKEKKKKKILTIAVPVSSRQQAIASMHTCSVTWGCNFQFFMLLLRARPSFDLFGYTV